MRRPHIEFYFNGLPVGFFTAESPPSGPGAYAYMPYRSPGHYALGQFLEAHGYADCVFGADGEMARFRVIGRPRYGTLVVEDFRVVPQQRD